MNNEEKKPLEAEDQETVNTSEGAKNTATGGFAGWWKSLAKNVKIAMIAGISCVLVAVIVLVVLLGGNNPGGPSGNGGGNGNGGGDGNDGTKVAYSISVVTKGGMAFAELPIYIYEYDDGSLGDMIAYGATDANGVATFNLEKNGSFAAEISASLPAGYDAQSFYPLVSTKLDITVNSSLLPDEGLNGMSFGIGSVMQDFTVTTTDGKSFTLSEVLKEKKAVFINFWYTECSWCVTEFPLMRDAYEKYKDDLAIIALDPPVINNDTLIDVKQFKEAYDLTFDVALDEEGLFSAFGVEGYPTSVMIDRYGVVTFIESGAITSERVFDVLFDFFTKDDYKQQLVYNYNDIVPKEKPNVQMPDSEEISNAFDGGSIPGIEYIPYRDTANDEEKEYSWPFVIDTVVLEGKEEEYTVIKTSNANKESSFSQMIINIELKAGDVLAFDYYSSTELRADILYVVVDGKDIYSISGQSEDWQTCYSYVAEEDGMYEVAFVYQKDSSENIGQDTVYLKDLRVVTESEIDTETYIYRFAATKPDGFGAYGDYVDVVLGSDGYYHVGSENGPILLADLMGYTRFSDEQSVYYIAGDLLTDKSISQAEYDSIIDYCSYASNSQIYGVSSVTEELRGLLEKISYYRGVRENENDWLRFCCYYDAYGTDGKQFEDPIKGLALFSAYDVILSEKVEAGEEIDYPNSFVYNRVIMPKGYLAKFTPTTSGTYLVTSFAPDPDNEGYGLETNAWIFTSNGFVQREAWYTYENVDRFNTTDANNCYMIAYFEAGKDYYIDIAFYDVYQEGTINFRVERLGDEGYFRFSLASPGYFTTLENADGDMASWLIHGGIDVVLGNDGIWREKRTDGREGSILYADFTMKTPILSHSLERMIDLGAFNFGLSEGDQYILNYLAINDGDKDKCREYLQKLWGEDYETYDEIYKIEEVFKGIYHGDGTDYTNTIKGYLSKVIVAGYNEQLDEVIAEDDKRIGCVIVTEELAEILQLLMDKYTFMNGVEPNTWSIENSWTKLCYYSQYFCAETPN